MNDFNESAERYLDGNYTHKYSGVQITAAREAFLAGAKCGYRKAVRDIKSQFKEEETKLFKREPENIEHEIINK